MSYRVGLGADFDFGTLTVRPLGTFDWTLYQTLGVYSAFSQRVAPLDELERSLSLGVTLTPLFLLRWSRALESGFAFWDLMIDSLGVSAGVQLGQPRGGTFAEEPGFELGLVMGLPIFLRANGLWLRLRGNLVTGRPPIPHQDRVEGALWVTLAWEGFFHAGLLDVN